MTKLFEIGMPAFVPTAPKSKALETVRITPRGESALVTGRNGVGKTSSLIEPFMRLVRMRQNGDKDRQHPAEYMAANDAALPYIFYIDLLIDDGAPTEPGGDMVLAGFYVENNNYGGDDSAPKENGFAFIVQHSSSIYENVDDDGWAYRKLGIDLLERDPSNPNRKRLLSSQEYKKALRASASRFPFCGTYQIKQGTTDRGFVEKLCALANYNFPAELAMSKSISMKEGMTGLKDLKRDAFLDQFVFAPLEETCLTESDRSQVRETLVKYCIKNLNQKKTMADLENIEGAIGDYAEISSRAEEAKAAAADLETARAAACGAASRIKAACAAAEISAEKLEQRESQNQEGQLEARKRMDSLEIRKQEKGLKTARAALSDTQIDLSVAMEGKARAVRSFYEAKAADAAFDADAAAAAEKATSNAMAALVSKSQASRLDDVAATLHSLHDARLTEAEAEADSAKRQLDEAESSFRAASKAKQDAAAESSASLAVVSKRDSAFSMEFARIKAALDAHGMGFAANDQENAVAWSQLEKRAIELSADAAEHEAASEKARADAASAKTLLTEAEEAEKAAEGKCADAAAAERLVSARLEQLKRATADLTSKGVHSADLESASSCDIASEKLNRASAAALSRCDELRPTLNALRKRLAAAKSGTLMLPENAMGLFEVAGIHAQPATDFLTKYPPSARDKILAEQPAVCACVVVADKDLRAARAIVPEEGTDWFAGAVGVLPHSAMEDIENLALDGFLACPDVEYIASPERRIAELGETIGSVEKEIARSSSAAAASASRAASIDAHRSTFFSSGMASAADYSSAADDAARFAEECRAAKQARAEERASAQEALEEASARDREQSSLASAAESEASELKALAKRADSLEDARADLIAAHQRLTESQKEQERATRLESDAMRLVSAAQRSLDAARASSKALEGELDGIRKPDGGKIVEGEFDALLLEYPKLIEAVKQDEPLIGELREECKKKSEAAREMRKASAARLEELRNHVAEEAQPPTPKKLDKEDEVALETAMNDAMLECTRAQAVHDAAREKAEDAEARLQELSGQYEKRYRAHPYARAEIYDDPAETLADLERDASEIARLKKRNASRRDKLSAAAGVLRDAGVALPDEPMPGVEPIDAETALDAAEKCAGELESKRAKLESARRSTLVKIDSHARRISLLGPDAPAVLARGRVQGASMRPAFCSMPLDEFASQLSSAEKSLEAMRASLTQDLDKAELELGAASSKVADIGKNMSNRIKKMQKAGNGEFKIEGFDQESGSELEYERHVANWISEVCRTAIAVAGTRADQSDRQAAIEKILDDDLLKPQKIVENRLSFLGLPAKVSIKFRSTRAGEYGKFVDFSSMRRDSGGEKAAAFIMPATALHSSNNLGRKGGSIMFLDTPFAGMTDNSLISRVFDVFDKTDTQVIVCQDFVAWHIVDRFGYQARLASASVDGAPCVVAEEVSSSDRVVTAYFRKRGTGMQPSLFSRSEEQ